MKPGTGLALAGLIGVMVWSAGCGRSRTWTGEISDAMCGGDHSAMGGMSDHDCAIACVRQMRSRYILIADPKTAFDLSDQKSPETFAGRDVRITGTLAAGTRRIEMTRIEAVD